jgi:competence protein ComEC
MKRPFALIGITYLSVQAALFYFQQIYIAAVVVVVCFVGAVVSLFTLKNKSIRHTALGFCITAAFASVIFGGYSALVRQPITEKYSGKDIYVTATVIEQPTRKYDYYKYLIETEQINKKSERLRINLSTISEINVEEFDRISCVLSVKECEQNSTIADGAFLQASADKNFAYIVKASDNKPLYYNAIKLRKSFANSLNNLMSNDSASLCRAVLLGEKSALSQDVQNDFTRCGVSFLIVVSGMHLAIICSFVFFCIKGIIRSRALRSLIMILCAFAFMAVSGFSPSVVRAGIMLAVVYSGKMFMRNGDSLNSLGIAALILTVPNPVAVADVGMLLSFTATLGIILWAQGMTAFIMGKFTKLNRLKRPVEFIVNLFSVSVSAAVWTMPFSVLLFGKVSLFSILLSVVLSPVVSVLVACALLTVIFNGIGAIGFIAYPFAFVCEWLSRFVLAVVGAISGIPFSYVNARKPYFYIWLGLAAVMVIAGCFVKNRAGYAVKSAVVSLCVLTLGFGIYSVIDVRNTELNIYATGGNTVMIRRGKNCSVISCDGDFAKIYSAVSGVKEDTDKLDFLIVPTDRESSAAYADIIQRKFDESDVLIYDSKGEFSDRENVKYFNRSFTVYLNENTKDEIVCAEGGVYQYISTDNTAVLLFDGELDFNKIPEKYRKADYVITDKFSKDIKSLFSGKVIITGNGEGIEENSDIIWIQDDNMAFALN